MSTKVKVIFLCVVGSLVFLSSVCVAGVNCSTQPECQATGTFGTLGGPTSLIPLGASKSGFTTIRFPANNYDISVGSDTTITDNLHKNWQFVYMGDAGLTSNVDVNFLGVVLEIDRLIFKGSEPRSVGMSQLNFTNVNLDTNTVRLDFQGSDNQINQTNSNVGFTSRDPFFDIADAAMDGMW